MLLSYCWTKHTVSYVYTVVYTVWLNIQMTLYWCCFCWNCCTIWEVSIIPTCCGILRCDTVPCDFNWLNIDITAVLSWYCSLYYWSSGFLAIISTTIDISNLYRKGAWKADRLCSCCFRKCCFECSERMYYTYRWCYKHNSVVLLINVAKRMTIEYLIGWLTLYIFAVINADVVVFLWM